jgi:PKD repeat protein
MSHLLENSVKFTIKNALKTILLFVSILLSSFSYCQDSLSVLFIGNSYIYTNDLPTIFKNITDSKGDIVTVDSKTNGGFTFQSHSNDPLTFQKIEMKPWDFVILQGQSQEPSFPYSQVNTSTLPYAVQLSDSVFANNPCSQVHYFMTWGRQNGDPQWDSINTFNKMNFRLRDAYLRIADSSKASVSPSGPAWKYVIDNYPTINLFSSDGSHPSYAGSYLSACVFYSSIFQKSPVGASFIGSLDANTALILQQAAALTVLDSISTWRLIHFDSLVQVDFTSTPLIQGNQIQFNSTASIYTDNLTWYFGDDMFSFEPNPMHEYNYNGSFIVSLVGSGECGTDTAYQVINITAASIENHNTDAINCFVNNSGEIELIWENSNFDIQSVKLFSSIGEIIPFQVIKRSDSHFILSLETKGFLYLHINASSTRKYIKLIKL